jgi:phospholipid/cholesterol/gamma-HCH transport system substrate-binding protein
MPDGARRGMRFEVASVRNTSVIGRVAAVAAVAVAIVAVVVIVFAGGGTSYTVKAIFQNASQVVSGDLVQASGNAIGTVSNISLTSHGQAQLTLDITNPAYEPLRRGTEATVRQTSLSAVANRYVDLRLAPGNAMPIIDGGTIGTTNTTSAVDLDQLFNTFTPATRKGLQDVIQGSAAQYAGSAAKAQAAWAYLNPAIASSSMLFAEINRDTAKFSSFLVKTGGLVSDIATRQSDLSGLVQNLSSTTSALANQHLALGQSIQRLPGFMVLADKTFANLRTSLDILTPLVNDSKPVAPKLQRLLIQLKPLANDSVPTVRDLSQIVSRPGPNNDLIELTKLANPLAAVTVRKIRANGALRPGAFTESTIALSQSTPELAFARPYAVDLTGWFEGYSHPGTIDANGGSSRVAPVVGIFSFDSGTMTAIPLVDRLLSTFKSTGLLAFGQGDRCPGSMERGALYYPETGYQCTPSEVPTGP